MVTIIREKWNVCIAAACDGGCIHIGGKKLSGAGNDGLYIG